MARVRRIVIAVTVLLAAVLGGVVAARSAPDARPPALSALDTMPADVETANVTDWQRVRDLLDVEPSDPGSLARVATRGFSTDLTSVSALADDAAVMADRYGWSIAATDWEAFGQSRDGQAVVVSLGAVDPADVVNGLERLGYTAPADDREAGGVWSGSSDLVASIAPRLTPLLGNVAVLADDGLVVLSDDPDYAAHTVEVASGEADSITDDAAVAAVATQLAGNPVMVVHRGERGCDATSLRTASRIDKAVAARLVGQGPALVAYDALGFGLSVGAGSELDVVMRFPDDKAAAVQRPVRLALTSGDAPAQGGTWEERFSAVEATLDGPDLVLRLSSDDRGARLLSDLGTGGLLFASCRTPAG